MMIARLIVSTILILIPALSAQAADINLVANGASPSDGTQQKTLRELWRAGGEDDDVFFGSVNQVCGDAAGNIYLLDIQLTEVYKYDAQGEMQTTLGRQGEGPGEVRNVNDMTLLPDGTLGFGQAFPGKIVKVGTDGTPGGSVPLGTDATGNNRIVVLLSTRSGGPGLAVAGMYWSFDEPGIMSQNIFLKGLNLDGSLGADFLAKDYPIEMNNFIFSEGNFDFVWKRFDLTPTGEVVFAPGREDYEVKVCALDGTPRLRFTRDYETVKRNKTEMGQARMSAESTSRQFGREVHGIEVEETEPAVTHLCVQDDGSIWVRTGRGDFRNRQGVLTTYDVFDGDGHFRRQVELLGPGHAANDEIYLLPNDRVVVVQGAVDAYRRITGTTGEDGADENAAAIEVICYGI
jgi:hypothetical protein